MVTVLHGENQVASRERFVQLKEEFEKKGWHITILDGKTVSVENISLASSSGSLLGKGNAIFVENYWVKKKKLKGEGEFVGEIVFWESKTLPSQLIQDFPASWIIKNFTVPRLVFRFLDALSPGKPQNTLRLLSQVLESEPPELIIPLLAWHIRQLIWAKEDPNTLNAPSWKKQKLISQASHFTREQLLSTHAKLLFIDRGLKTGTYPLPISSSLDLLIAEL